jgi:predicted nucleic-acid-binding protein
VKAVDTNVLVRYLVNDDKTQYRAAAAFFDAASQSGATVHVDTIVLCELVWVLRSSYEYTREELAEVIERLLTTEDLEIEDSDSAWLALEDYRRTRADFADCLIGRRNLSAGCESTVSFDGRLKGLKSFELLPHSTR